MKKESRNLIIGLVTGVVFVALVFWSLNLPSVEMATNNSTGVIPSSAEPSKIAVINEKPRNLIPGTNYTCEDLIPESVLLVFPGDKYRAPTGGFTLLGNNESLLVNYGDCKRNTQPGENINLFECDGSYSIFDRVTPEGIIQKNYRVKFHINSDNRNCTFSYNAGGGEAKICKVIFATCKWDYI